ncbi:hypothetical protein [Nannocystis bainbridge]|uniref:Uncharacterized protein n=1 Tax=Nannocystis bainbridge TaxID=2995303 RepID=A0ABT5EDM1_9BACT|nr:hypothetical protein [Nannocystis bainbridge]MDC0722881.1 hypothetical protein [Nannocystis bainbridge]
MALLPETRLFPCTACHELACAADPACPHCGTAWSPSERAGRLAALAAALAMAACNLSDPQPEYGSPDTITEGGTTETTGTDATTTTSTTTTSTTSTDTTDTDPTSAGTTPTTGTSTTSDGTTDTDTTDATGP